MKRLKGKPDLLEFSVDKYHYYYDILANEHNHTARKYLKEILKDLLIIQHYARGKNGNGNGEGR